MQPPHRQIRAVFNNRTITLYQAYAPAIAEPALKAGRFVAPFKLTRMTWVKPSFLWMAYRSGWATKLNQERVLAVEITRDGFEWALARACLSHFDPDTHGNHHQWKAALSANPVRIQWDPERDIHFNPLAHRSIQIGLSGRAIERYVNEWIVSLTDITEQFRSIQELVTEGQIEHAHTLLPPESEYPITATIATRIGASICTAQPN